MPPRVLITGGTGYIARRLASRLLADGWHVSATRRGANSIAGLDPRVHWVRVDDIGPATDWHDALREIDVVLHLAGVAHRIDVSHAELEAEYERVNAQGTAQLARELVARGRGGRIVLLSSIGAVCVTSESPVGATTPPRPTNAYGRSKLHAEQLLDEACRNSDVQWCTLRAPLVYGPEAPGNMRRLLKLAARGLPLPLGKADARRSFVFVDNLVDALMTCASHPGVVSRVLPVADSETVSVAELMRMVAEFRGRPVRLLPVPESWMRSMARIVDAIRPGPADRNDSLSKSLSLLFGSLVLDISELRRLAQWQPPFSLRDGIRATVIDASERPT